MSFATPFGVIWRAIGSTVSGPGKITSTATLPSSRTPSDTVRLASQLKVPRGGIDCVYQARR